MDESSSEDEEIPAAVDANRFSIWSGVFRTVNRLITAVMLLGIAYFAFRAIESLSGEVTLVTASFSLLKSSYGLPWGLAALMFAWALGERQLRRRKTRAMQNRIERLELHIDPGGKSNGSLPTGRSELDDE